MAASQSGPTSEQAYVLAAENFGGTLPEVTPLRGQIGSLSAIASANRRYAESFVIAWVTLNPTSPATRTAR